MITSIPSNALQRFSQNPCFWLVEAVTSCCNFSLIPFGRGPVQLSRPLDSRPKRLRNYHWLIAEVSILKKIKTTFWPSLLPLSIVTLNHFALLRTPRVFIYDRLLQGQIELKSCSFPGNFTHFIGPSNLKVILWHLDK